MRQKSGRNNTGSIFTSEMPHDQKEKNATILETFRPTNLESLTK